MGFICSFPPVFCLLGIQRAQKSQHPGLKEEENFLIAKLPLIPKQSPCASRDGQNKVCSWRRVTIAATLAEAHI